MRLPVRCTFAIRLAAVDPFQLRGKNATNRAHRLFQKSWVSLKTFLPETAIR
jgi:hypothetical protein